MKEKIQQNRHIIVAILAMILCLGIMDKLVMLIDKFLMPVFGHEANNWLSILFLAFTLVVLYWIYTGWVKNKKVFTEKEWAWLIFGEFVYWYFRAISSEYVLILIGTLSLLILTQLLPLLLFQQFALSFIQTRSIS